LLVQMLPPAGMKQEPIRLCGACYAESPCHKMEWQFKTVTGVLAKFLPSRLGIIYACCWNVPTVGRGLRFRLCRLIADVSGV